MIIPVFDFGHISPSTLPKPWDDNIYSGQTSKLGAFLLEPYPKNFRGFQDIPRTCKVLKIYQELARF
jgi:hypothetical protein